MVLSASDQISIGKAIEKAVGIAAEDQELWTTRHSGLDTIYLKVPLGTRRREKSQKLVPARSEKISCELVLDENLPPFRFSFEFRWKNNKMHWTTRSATATVECFRTAINKLPENKGPIFIPSRSASGKDNHHSGNFLPGQVRPVVLVVERNQLEQYMSSNLLL